MPSEEPWFGGGPKQVSTRVPLWSEGDPMRRHLMDAWGPEHEPVGLQGGPTSSEVNTQAQRSKSEQKEIKNRQDVILRHGIGGP